MSQPRSRQAKVLNLLVSTMLVLLGAAVSACAEPPPTATIPPSPTTTLPPEASTPSPEAIEEPSGDETPETSRAKRCYPIVLEGHTDAVRSAEFSPAHTWSRPALMAQHGSGMLRVGRSWLYCWDTRGS